MWVEVLATNLGPKLLKHLVQSSDFYNPDTVSLKANVSDNVTRWTRVTNMPLSYLKQEINLNCVKVLQQIQDATDDPIYYTLYYI